MKRFVCLTMVSWLFVSAVAQTSLGISTDKTTTLVFPFPVQHVDRGTQSLLVQVVKEAPTILLVKAASKDFSETSLSVITEDGSIYSFLVGYDPNPSLPAYHLPIGKKATPASYANALLNYPPAVRGIKDTKWKVTAGVTGIFIKGEVLYFQLTIKNNSPLDYDIDLLKFFIKDKKKTARSAVQEAELVPLYIAGNTAHVNANKTAVLVIALDKITIPGATYLSVELMEKNSGRHFQLKINNKHLLRAMPLPY